MNLRNEFLAFIKKSKLVNQGDKILLTVSGGLDSIVMAELFFYGGIEFGIAHCNFQLRSNESDGDETFVENLANSYEKPFYVNHFNTKEFASERGISIQMAARELRYSWFEAIRESQEFSAIATAHHKDDSVETILFNLIKGTGLEGLKGIPVRNGNVIRPLLFATRKDLEAHASDHDLKWREDSSNKSTDYTRNQIRIGIIPRIRKINPGFNDSIIRSVERVNDAQSLLRRYIDEIVERAVKVQGMDLLVDKAEIKKAESRVLLHDIIRDYGFTYDQAETIWELMDQQPGKQFYSGEYILVIDRSSLIISSKSDNNKGTLSVSEESGRIDTSGYTLKITRFDFRSIDKKLPNHVAQIDFDKLKFPLSVRSWKIGDYFYPLGMKSKKKLSDFMIDIKIPLNLKRRIKVIESGGEIVWIAGYRIDERYKLNKSTKQIYQIEYFESNEESI